MRPIHGAPVTCPYGRKGSAWVGGKHRGIDFGAPLGTLVRAPWSGTVIGIGTWGRAFGDRSPVIDFDRLPGNRPGWWGVLAHLDMTYLEVGQHVDVGDRVGRVGTRGNTTGPHLHFEVHRSPRWTSPRLGLAVNPRRHLQAQPPEDRCLPCVRDDCPRRIPPG